MRSSRSRLKAAATILVAAALLFATRRLAFAHAALVASEPRAASVLPTSPGRVWLLFTEPLEPTLAHVSLISGDGTTIQLQVAADPHDVHALTSPLDPLAAGAYRVVWHIVSADGHPVSGSYVFTVGQASAHASAPPDPTMDTPGAEGMHDMHGTGGVPTVTALLRGLGLGSLMALGGMLLFLTWPSTNVAAERRRRRVATWLAIATPVLLALHVLAWVVHVSPTEHFDAAFASSALASGVGHIELWRTGLALLATWALVLARRVPLALVFATGALLVSGMSGHAAAIHEVWTAPAKALHLAAGAAWLGGLVWLAVSDRRDMRAFTADALRVSAVALASVVVVTLSGFAQAFLILPSPMMLFHSTYGAMTIGKIVGLLVLVGFGAHHRYRVLPTLDAASANGFAGSLVREIAVMGVVILLGGLLAYTSPPQPAAAAHDMHQGMHMPASLP